MIIDTNVEIILNSRNIKRLIYLGYNGKIGEKIKISVEHLSTGSKCKINVKCDICGKEKYVNYLNYNKHTKNGKSLYYCINCKEIKTKKTCLKKYGVENPMKIEQVKDNLKNSILEKYGVENAFQSDIIKEKIKKTNLKKYGVTSPLQNEEIKQKMKQTNLKKYGVEMSLQNEEIKQKSKNTCLKKYGVDSYIKTDNFKNKSIKYHIENKNEIIKKSKKTNMEKYGTENPFANKKIQRKIRQSCLNKYGVEFPAQNEEIFLKTQKSRFKIKKYKNSNLYYQGTYEKDFLDNFYDKINIQKSKSINYIFENKNHYYHPDFYLPDFNLIVEIKSKYIYELELEQNMLKQQACLNDGYNYIFIIDKNYIEIEKLIK
jgi:hypothetical protein